MKILKVEQPGQTTPAGQVLRLQTGQRLAAISLSDARPGERATLSVAGGQLQVTTQHPLKAGQAIDLEVTRLGEQVHLRPLGPPPDPRQLDQAQLTRNLLQALARVGTTGAGNTTGTSAPTTPTPTPASVAANPAQAQTAQTQFTRAQSTQAQITQAQTNPPPSPQASPAAGTARGITGNAATPATPATPSPPQATGTAGGATTSIPAAILQATRPGGVAAATESMLRAALNQGVTSGTTTTGPGAAGQANAALATPAVASPTAQTVPPGLNGLLPLLSALREPRLIQGLVAGWLATADNPARSPNPLAGVGGPIPAPAGQGLTDTPLGSLLQQAARSLRAQPDLAPRDPAARQATLEFMQRIGDQVERSQLATALSQGAAGAAAGTQTGPNQPTWLLEIPLQLANEAHTLRLGIREEDESGEARDGGGRWRIDLAMEWPRLGPLHAALVMQGEQIDVDLFADQPETVSLLESTRPTLAKALSDSGLTPGRLGAYPGPPPASARARLEPDTSGAAGSSAPRGFLSEQA
ncbi:flagellar hook-length control protein FliK [Guyparkeria sp. SB14A]|uniref:flagellar hook-length control protein FliK n=1 Tax=Guyparkeria sp. SB14A TaxID=2571147 RepID=UPI0010ACAB46|nr:flagellar hook-length control protein FliK [Guyparkeria sp. SB14A]TKA90593.1 flagellar hook-length control protein FliK [Guyparkeria sp. SB14A]